MGKERGMGAFAFADQVDAVAGGRLPGPSWRHRTQMPGKAMLH